MSSAPSIPDGPEGDEIRNLFRAYHLEPKKPDHWYALVRALFEMHQRQARSGAPRQWTDTRLVHLACEIAIVRLSHPAKSESDLCRLLAKKKGPFQGISWKTLRRRLYDARNPEVNKFLGSLLESLVAEHGEAKRMELLAQLTTGVVDVYEDESGKLAFIFREARSTSRSGRWLGSRPWLVRN